MGVCTASSEPTKGGGTPYSAPSKSARERGKSALERRKGSVRGSKRARDGRTELHHAREALLELVVAQRRLVHFAVVLPSDEAVVRQAVVAGRDLAISEDLALRHARDCRAAVLQVDRASQL